MSGIRRSRFRVVFVFALAASALIVAANSGLAFADASARDRVAAAVRKVQTASSVSEELDLQGELQPNSDGAINAKSVVDGVHQEASITTDIVGFGSISESDPGRTQTVFTPDATYVSYSGPTATAILNQLHLPAGVTWVKFDHSQSSQTDAVGGTPTAGSSALAELVGQFLLNSHAAFVRVGMATVPGDKYGHPSGTEYRATITISKYLHTLTSKQRSSMSEYIMGFSAGGLPRVSADVIVDNQGRLRNVRIPGLAGPGARVHNAVAQYTASGFGAPVTVDLPSPAQTVDASSLPALSQK